MSLYLINTVTIVQNSNPSKIFAGDLISDTGIQADVLAAGGVLGPSTDTNLAAAAAEVAKLRSHGANEADCTAVMMAAYASTAYTVAAAAEAVATQEASYTLTAAEVAALGASLTGTLAFAAALPAGARFLGVEMNVTVAAAGTTTLTAELGDGTTATEYMGAKTVQSTGKSAQAGSATVMQSAGGVTPTITMTSTGSNLSAVTGLVATVKLFYTVLA